MFFLIPWATYLFIYLAAALLPALFLMRYIYRKDSWEPEPVPLLVSLALSGVLAGFLSGVLEGVFGRILSFLPINKDSHLYTILTAFLVVAAVEEGMKAYLLYRRTWEDANFNYSFDAVVYSAFVSLGFAAIENLIYVFTYGLSVALPRAALAIPGHFGFSVVFGYFYGRARERADLGFFSASRANLLAGYVLAVFLHGFYDSCAMLGTSTSLSCFLLFIIILYLVIFKVVEKAAREDKPLY
ncbi:MAG: PrsW family intramembrane metalloprotease [Blautia sp.]|nr:PrsW family intramembrane metalloprotease [Blautia sp.]